MSDVCLSLTGSKQSANGMIILCSNNNFKFKVDLDSVYLYLCTISLVESRLFM